MRDALRAMTTLASASMQLINRQPGESTRKSAKELEITILWYRIDMPKHGQRKTMW